MVAWSRIQGTELAGEAFMCIADNNCAYHNLIHVDEMYQYLEDTNEPYDEALDWAVLFHDIVYDAHPEKEERSGKLFLEMVENYRGCNLYAGERSRVYSLIMRTIDHEVLFSKGSSAIIRADLHTLANKVRTTQNFVKIMNESMELYGCTVEEFADNNIKFMAGLHQRVAVNSTVDIEHKQFYIDVMKGINLTIRLAQAIKDIK
jgi:predicted metal-dependent HD superfamily phosphohydrolase